jgi:hypothetical protein
MSPYPYINLKKKKKKKKKKKTSGLERKMVSMAVGLHGRLAVGFFYYLFNGILVFFFFFFKSLWNIVDIPSFFSSKLT